PVGTAGRRAGSSPTTRSAPTPAARWAVPGRVPSAAVPLPPVRLRRARRGPAHGRARHPVAPPAPAGHRPRRLRRGPARLHRAHRPRLLEPAMTEPRARRARAALRLAGPAAGVVVLGACSRRAPSTLDPHGSAAARINGVWWLMLALAVAVFAVVGGLLLVGAFRRPR